jgi:hypothetical protein
MAPCEHGWQRRLTLDGSQVLETLVDFPILVRLTDPHLQAHAAKSGDDVYFTADDQSSLLDFELESYRETGELVAWVRIPTLTPGSDTQLYLGYGDGLSRRAESLGVWRAFHDVWHLAQDPSAGTAAIRDSTARAHGTAHRSMTASALVAGVAGPALAFDGVDDEIAFSNDIRGQGPSTFSGWVKHADKYSKYGSSLVSLGNGNRGEARFVLPAAKNDLTVKCGFYGDDDDISTAVLPPGEWKYVSWTWDGRASSLYVDAVRVSGPVTHANVNTRGSSGKIGNTSFSFEYFMTGSLDEVRIATTARSRAWISLEYANQRPGSKFIKAIGEPVAALPPSHAK